VGKKFECNLFHLLNFYEITSIMIVLVKRSAVQQVNVNLQGHAFKNGKYRVLFMTKDFILIQQYYSKNDEMLFAKCIKAF